MFEHFKSILVREAREKRSSDAGNNLQVATCALFIEMAKADDNFSPADRDMILSIMKETFDLDDEQVDTLFSLAEQQVKKSVSIYEFTTLIDEQLSTDEKFELMKNLWRLIYSDKVLDKYEDNLIKRVGDILKMEHRDVINAKLIVKKELNL